jgi:hypothetical protein
VVTQFLGKPIEVSHRLYKFILKNPFEGFEPLHESTEAGSSDTCLDQGFVGKRAGI